MTSDTRRATRQELAQSLSWVQSLPRAEGAPEEPVVSTFRWGTVKTVEPFTVVLDGDDTPIMPDSLTKTVEVDDRVWTQIHGRYALVLGVGAIFAKNWESDLAALIEEVDQKATDAKEAAEAADTKATEAKEIAESALGSANGINTITHSLNDPTAADPGTDGDTWFTHAPSHDPVGAPLAGPAASLWVWSGGGWTKSALSGTVLTALDAGSITTGALSGINLYSPSSATTPRWQVVGPTTSIVRSDNEGREFISLSLGGESADQLVLFDASGTPMAGFDSTGKGLAQSLDVTDVARVGSMEVDGALTVGGETLEQMLWRLPRGVVARQSLGDSAAGRSVRFRSELGYYGITWRAEPGRLYRVVYAGLASVSGGGIFHFRMRAGSSPGDQAPTVPRISTHPQVAVTTLTPSRPGTHQVHLESWVQDYDGTYTVIVTAEAVGTFDGVLLSGDTYPAELIVEDMGARMSKGDGYYHRAGGTPYSGTPPVETAPPPTRRKYTTTWAANWEASWRGGSLVTDFLQQGYYSPAQRYSMVGFTAGNGTGGHPGWSPTGILGSGGVTIDSIEVWLENESWWYGSGGKARIGRHGNTSAPGSPQTSGGGAFDSPQWTTGSGRWVKLPSSWYAGFATGANRGITLGEGVGSDQTYYGKFKRGVTKLRATYWK